MIVWYVVALLLSNVVFGMEKRIVPYERPHKSQMKKTCMLLAVAADDIEEVRHWWSQGCLANMYANYTVKCSNQTFTYMTPLMVATFHGHIRMTDFFISRGAHSGETPLDYAVRLQYPDCIDAMHDAILEKYKLVGEQHCGFTKHILIPGPCLTCAIDLRQQLRSHGLWQDTTKDNLLHITAEINPNSVYSCAESGS